MPLIIRELIIRTSVDQGGQAVTPPEADVAAGDGGGKGRQEIVAECVDQVLDILRNREER